MGVVTESTRSDEKSGTTVNLGVGRLITYPAPSFNINIQSYIGVNYEYITWNC